jgi:U3 small nucleolar RNA-associated protein 14
MKGKSKASSKAGKISCFAADRRRKGSKKKDDSPPYQSRVESTEGTEEQNAISESEDEETQHQNLIEAVLSTTRKRSAQAQRSEPSLKPSEYNLSKPEGTHVEVGELLSPLKNLKQFRSLQKRLKVVQDGSERLDPPLPKVHADQLQRKAMFVEASNKISEWLPTIKKNREADHLYFTHQEGKPPHPSLNILVESHKPRTPLEKEISQLLSNSEHAVPSPQDGLTAAERRSLERMALQEVRFGMRNFVCR